ncbi:DUF1552 domain-containing protein [Bremerella cremea]|uniref:DUF1552 domain-containing protein n=1 Tax=Blastopirellula marina TaxID=124 RepID=A0A2S8FKU9_9BACT|nr:MULTISPECIES: DUF1552 domain-containing protein [Pirellulaceae]PQO32554.1 hypothetical protein C5Y83_20285 [Blastopirellula marina]RCS45621.1 DUF1552 domain-containing protein [Bremerella cremea]
MSQTPNSTTMLSRRTILRGMGTALALPWLESICPVARAAGTDSPAAKPPVRMGFFYVPNGMHMADWTPKGEGELKELSPTLSQLSKHRSEIMPLSGLELHNGWALGDGGGDHARSVASFLTGAHPNKTDGADIRNGVSVDQFAASQLSHLTRFPSLELGLEPSAQSGNCDSGYSCVYSSNVSWRNDTNFVNKEVNPQALFDRLFGNGNSAEEAENKALRNRRKKSVLDFVLNDAKRLQDTMGSVDRRKMDEYLHSVRDVERRVAHAIKLEGKEIEAPDYARPEGVPAEFQEHARLMMDMLVLAFQTDATRIATFMMTNAGSNRPYPQVEVSDGHHDLSHHQNDGEKQKKIAKINRFHIQQFDYLLTKMREVKEGEGTLLDNCMLMYGSGLSDGNRHNHDDLPIVLAGRAGGAFKPGRHLRYADKTPLCNLYVSMLEVMGINADNFSDSNGRLTNLG